MKQQQTDNNYYIDFLKFIFSLIIVFYHARFFSDGSKLPYFSFGYHGVDFYFIVTGYLMMNSINKRKNIKKESISISTFHFIKNKFLRLFPSLLVTFIIGYFLVYGISGLSTEIIFDNSIIAELFQFSILGYDPQINTSWWYISSMLIGLMIIYPFAKKYGKDYVYFLAPLLLIITLELVIKFGIPIDDPLGYTFIFKNGLYKGLIYMLLGNICYEIAQKIKGYKLTKKQKIFLTILETVIYLFLIFNMQYCIIGTIWFAILFTLNIAITFSNQTYITNLFKSEIWKKIGKFGFYLFLTNVSVRTFVLSHFIYTYRNMTLIMLIITIGVSTISYILTEIIIPKIKTKRT